MANEVPRLERQESAQPAGAVPHYGRAMQQISAEGNLLGTIGARVAQESSQALAAQLGTVAGKNPHGELFPAITDFDKHFSTSYANQANAELSLQANKLISDSEIQLASATRLTPELIKQTNAQVSIGLSRIAANAPNSIKPGLQSSFANTMIAQNQKYQVKMITEQREDAKQKILASMNQELKNIHDVGTNGNVQGGFDGAKNLEKMARSAEAAHQITPDQANIMIDSAQKTAKAAKYISEALQKRAEGKYEEFIGNFAKSKPSDLSQSDWEYVAGAISNKIGQLDNLRAKDEALRTSNFQLSMARDITGISGAQIQDYKESVSPQTFNETMIAYEKALKKANRDTNSVTAAHSNFSDPNRFRNSSDKALLGALDEQATELSNKNGVPLHLAEAQTAASAAGPIKGYIARLDTKAQFGSPQQLNEAIAARDLIASSTNPQNLSGLKDASNAMMNNYIAMRANHDEPTAAALAREIAYNNDPQKAKALDESYANYVKNKKKSGETESAFALRIADIDKNAFVNIPELNEYVKDKFAGYFKINNGNVDMATKQLQQDIGQTFDYDTINGRKQYTLFPIKKMFNLPENSNGFIHQDMKEQIDKQLTETKALYDAGQFDYYWEVKPNVSFEELGHALVKSNESWNPKPGQYKDSQALAKAHAEFERDKKIYNDRINEYKQGKPPTAIQHWRDGHIQEYDLEIRAEPQMGKKADGGIQGFYDVRLQNKNGTQSFILANPNQTKIRYQPNRGRIIENYLKVYPIIEQTYGPKEIVGSQLMMLGR